MKIIAIPLFLALLAKVTTVAAATFSFQPLADRPNSIVITDQSIECPQSYWYSRSVHPDVPAADFQNSISSIQKAFATLTQSLPVFNASLREIFASADRRVLEPAFTIYSSDCSDYSVANAAVWHGPGAFREGLAVNSAPGEGFHTQSLFIDSTHLYYGYQAYVDRIFNHEMAHMIRHLRGISVPLHKVELQIVVQVGSAKLILATWVDEFETIGILPDAAASNYSENAAIHTWQRHLRLGNRTDYNGGTADHFGLAWREILPASYEAYFAESAGNDNYRGDFYHRQLHGSFPQITPFALVSLGVLYLYKRFGRGYYLR